MLLTQNHQFTRNIFNIFEANKNWHILISPFKIDFTCFFCVLIFFPIMHDKNMCFEHVLAERWNNLIFFHFFSDTFIRRPFFQFFLKADYIFTLMSSTNFNNSWRSNKLQATLKKFELKWVQLFNIENVTFQKIVFLVLLFHKNLWGVFMQ